MKRFSEFINKEVENGIMRYAVTSRLVALVRGVYFLGMLILAIVYGRYYVSILSLAALIGCIKMFHSSYVRCLGKVDFCIDDSLVIMTMFAFSMLLGVDTGVMNLMFPQILLIFALGSYSKCGRYLWIAGMMVTRAVVFEYQKTVAPYYQLGVQERLNLMTLNFVTVCVLLIVIAAVSTKDARQVEQGLISHNSELQNLASIDSLTGLRNRRSISGYLESKAEDYRVGRLQGLSVAIGDIDFFKKVNDTYGHDCGDIVLRDLATVFRTFMMGKGTVGRWGGEEFLFVFANMNGDEASAQLSDLQTVIRNMEFRFRDEQLHLTMTFGLSEYDYHRGIDGVIKEADEKLYMGKERGRNTVIY